MCLRVCFAKPRPEVCVWVFKGCNQRCNRSRDDLMLPKGLLVNTSMLICLGSLLNLAVKTDEYQHSCPVFHAEKTAWKHEKKLSDWMCFDATTWTWRRLVVLMVWNNVRNASHGTPQGASHHIHLNRTPRLSFSPSSLTSPALRQNEMLSHDHLYCSLCCFVHKLFNH